MFKLILELETILSKLFPICIRISSRGNLVCRKNKSAQNTVYDKILCTRLANSHDGNDAEQLSRVMVVSILFLACLSLGKLHLSSNHALCFVNCMLNYLKLQPRN